MKIKIPKFKNKKDKRIEELEKLLVTQSMAPSKVIYEKQNLIPIKANIILQDEMPMEYAKYILARSFAEVLKEHIHYTIEDVDGKRMLNGYLYIKSNMEDK